MVRSLTSSAALRELLFLAAGYVFYTLARLVADDDVQKARIHAGAIVRVEHHLGLGFEHSLNLGLSHLPFVLQLAACVWYATLHYIVTPTALFLLWKRRPDLYSRGRWVLVLATVIALCVYLTYPVAPPRLMGGGFIDTMFDTSRWGWWGADASAPRGLGVTTNDLAAMPSMHVGWAVWSAWALSHVTERRWLRRAVWAYPVGTALVVIATGNHWVLDVVAGAAVVFGVLAWLGEPDPAPTLTVARPAPVAARAIAQSVLEKLSLEKLGLEKVGLEKVSLDKIVDLTTDSIRPPDAGDVIDVAALDPTAQQAQARRSGPRLSDHPTG